MRDATPLRLVSISTRWRSSRPIWSLSWKMPFSWRYAASLASASSSVARSSATWRSAKPRFGSL
jgi:hypothetical protein